MASEHTNALPRGYRIDEYELVRVLGAGGFGITYLGFDHNLDKQVAIKEYLPRELATRIDGSTVAPHSSGDQSDFEWGLDRFLEEARVLARFDHPNIIKVYRFFRNHGTGYIVMDYAEGESLSAYLGRQGTITEPQLRGILMPSLSGLNMIHAGDVLHRDIKPGNIMIRTDGTPVLIDFGAARQAMNNKSLSVTSIVTPGYAPIEQYSTKGNQGPWTDIYALGAVAYRCLMGHTPEDATDRILDDEMVPAVEAAKGKASPEFLAAIDAALAIREADRPQTIADWIEMFGEVPENVLSIGGGRSRSNETSRLNVSSGEPKSGGGSKTGLFVGLGLLVAAGLGAGGYFAMGGFGGGDGGSTTGGGQGTTAAVPQQATVALTAEQITTVQAQLLALGYRVAKNGEMDARTKLELTRFQMEKGLPQSGVADAPTMQRLKVERDRVDQKAWLEASGGHTVSGYAAYLKEWSDGNYRTRAEAAIKQLQADEARLNEAEKRAAQLAKDDDAYAKAQGQHTLDAYRAYLKNFPKGRHVAQATQAFDRLNAVRKAEEKAKQDRAETTLRKEAQTLLIQMGYDVDNRSGRATTKTNKAVEEFRGEVGLPVSSKVDLILLSNMRQVAEDRLWAKTKKARSARAYETYLDSYPDGRYAAEARDNLGKAKQMAAMADAEKTLTRSIQTELGRLGYKVRTNGDFDTATATAIELFEQETGRKVTGEMSDELLANLKATKTRPGKEMKIGGIVKDCEACPPLVVVPTGSLTMTTKTKKGEPSVRKIAIDTPFAVAVAEVTFDEWDACVAAFACQHKGDPGFGKGQLPVVGVSFNDAQNYVGFLSARTGKPYRLLSEAEWQYTAGAGVSSAYAFGDNAQEICAYGNVAGKESGFDWGKDGCTDQHGQTTAPVKSYKPNKFGVYDMHGNAAEWVADCWHDDYEGAPTNRKSWESGGDCNWRILRGGSWRNAVDYSTLDRRSKMFGVVRANTNGFRVVRDLVDGEGQ